MSRLRLSNEDRQRLGGPEWLERPDDPITLKEAEALEAAGWDWADWPSPGSELKLANVSAWVWIALRRNGVNPPPRAEFDITLGAVGYDSSPGKARSAPGAKPTRTRSGGGRTGSSTRSSRTS